MYLSHLGKLFFRDDKMSQDDNFLKKRRENSIKTFVLGRKFIDNHSCPPITLDMNSVEGELVNAINFESLSIYSGFVIDTNFTDCVFDTAVLSKVDIKNCQFTRCEFNGGKFQELNFINCKFGSVSFFDIQHFETMFQKSTINGMKFIRNRCENIDFFNSDVQDIQTADNEIIANGKAILQNPPESDLSEALSKIGVDITFGE